MDLIERRLQLQRSRAALADLCGVSSLTVFSWEIGFAAIPPFSAQLIATWLKIPLDQLQFRHRKPRNCWACGQLDIPVERAHFKPAFRGGTQRAENIVLLCPNHHTMLDSKGLDAPEQSDVYDNWRVVTRSCGGELAGECDSCEFHLEASLDDAVPPCSAETFIAEFGKPNSIRLAGTNAD